MRILQLRFKNLNSLAGEWSIDFTHPSFTHEGIFAIVGPTGAGKSTILDAICLALYGRTPRLNKVTKSTNEIMSRHTGACFAEVTFATPAGQFRCHWSQHRSRKKTNGEFQPPKHEIADAVSGQIFETKMRDVASQIETVTGMDFERFTRSMLLAQGGFAAFLQANPDERAPILEQITGTEIYSQISITVHERWSEERKKLNLLQAELSHIPLLDETEEQVLKENFSQKIFHEAEIRKQLEQKTQTLAWLDGLERLQKELSTLQEQQEQLQLQLPEQELKAKKAEEMVASAQNDFEQKKIRCKQDMLLIRQVQDIDLKLKEKEVGARALHNALAALDKYLGGLQEGKPCPLCGSTEHPFHQNSSGTSHPEEVNLQSQKQLLRHFMEEKNLLANRRQEIFGTQDPAQEEAQLVATLEQSEKNLEILKKNQLIAHQELAKLKNHLEVLEKSLATQKNQIQAAQELFQTKRELFGFVNEAQPRKQLTEELSAMTHQLREFMQELGRLKQKLDHNEGLKRRQEQQKKIFNAQKKEFSRWEMLHDLIGSVDGKKYRNFAQGLTFDVMIHHANQQLQKMTDRYLLTRKGAQPLELNVIDAYQTAEIRSTKNLSGGESFIVSLALALGLSQMASKNVRVDSLFLDEGFGTLDEEALDTALGTLAGLQQEGKLIGVISHIAALKERIGVQIEVKPQGNGKSVLLGPGTVTERR